MYICIRKDIGNIDIHLYMYMLTSYRYTVACFSFQEPKFILGVTKLLRFKMPRKPFLTSASLGGDDGYAELGSRFKASHIKLIIWWLAKECQEFADGHPNVTRKHLCFFKPSRLPIERFIPIDCNFLQPFDFPGCCGQRLGYFSLWFAAPY